MISQKAKYALRALVALARAPRGEPVLISDIAERQSIPKKFLEQILLDLKHQGIVASRRGKFGGYQLLKAPEDITFGSILSEEQYRAAGEDAVDPLSHIDPALIDILQEL